MTEPIQWYIDGTALSSEAWGVAEWGGSSESPPKYRGGALTIPYRRGQLWRPGVPDSRTITLPMWLTDQHPTTGTYGGSSQMLDNWRALRNLFTSTGGRQLAIRKVWDGGYGDATGYGQYAGGLEPENYALTGAKFDVDLFMADPYFYGTEHTLGTFNSGTYDITGDILGDVSTGRYSLTFAGALSGFSLTIKQGSEVLSSLTSSMLLSTGKTLSIAMPDLTWSTDQAGQSVAMFTPGQQSGWIDLDPSATSLVVAATGAGSVTIRYYPAWL